MPATLIQRVLAVDDDPSIRTVIKAILTKAKLSVEVAQNGAEALKIIGSAEVPFDLVIMDLTMPVMNGLLAIKEITCRYPDLPIIVCSGSTSDLKAAENSSVSVIGVITKPFSIIEFVQEIKKRLEQHQPPEITLPEVYGL